MPFVPLDQDIQDFNLNIPVVDTITEYNNKLQIFTDVRLDYLQQKTQFINGPLLSNNFIYCISKFGINAFEHLLNIETLHQMLNYIYCRKEYKTIKFDIICHFERHLFLYNHNELFSVPLIRIWENDMFDVVQEKYKFNIEDIKKICVENNASTWCNFVIYLIGRYAPDKFGNFKYGFDKFKDLLTYRFLNYIANCQHLFNKKELEIIKLKIIVNCKKQIFLELSSYSILLFKFLDCSLCQHIQKTHKFTTEDILYNTLLPQPTFTICLYPKILKLIKFSKRNILSLDIKKKNILYYLCDFNSVSKLNNNITFNKKDLQINPNGSYSLLEMLHLPYKKHTANILNGNCDFDLVKYLKN